MTLKEIADQVGVSISTVSRVVNTRNPHAASSELQQAIWECVRKNAYVPRANAKRTITQDGTSTGEKSPVRFIACIFARNNTSVSDNTYFTGLAKCFEKTSLSLHYSAQNFFTAIELNERNLETMASQHLDGVVIIGRHDLELIERIHKVVPHMIYAGLARPAADNYDSVTCDRFRIGAVAADYLLKLGHKRIAYIGEAENEITYDGFIDTLEKNGCCPQDTYRINLFASMENGYLGMKKLLEQKNRPTAIFCMNDYVAMGALRAAHECNVHCPKEISILGVDDIESSNYTTPKLTTIHTPMEELGTIAAKILIDRIEGGHTIPLKISLPFSLVERESCSLPKKE